MRYEPAGRLPGAPSYSSSGNSGGAGLRAGAVAGARVRAIAVVWISFRCSGVSVAPMSWASV